MYRAAILTILLFLPAPPPSPAAIYTVDDDGPADFSSIQDAIDSASNCDVVEVLQGTYNESINFRNK